MPIKTIIRGEVERLEILSADGQLDGVLAEGTLSDEDVRALYEQMIICREFDDASFKLQRSGRMGTFPQNIGHEAVSLGTARALRKGVDWVVPYYREHPALFLHGLPMHYVLLSWMGDERGNQINHKLSMSPMSVVIGQQCLHAVGISWAFKLRKEDRAAIVYFGDGATSTGDFHEAMNFASVMKTPTIFCCINNCWAISVPNCKQTGSRTFAQKALAYDIPTVQVDGNDLFACYRATREALERARAGQGPSFIEAVTYRLGDHTTADDARRYRSQEEFDLAMQADPIVRTRKYLESRGLWNDDLQSKTEERAKVICREVIDAAFNVEKPATDDLFRYTFDEMPEELIRQMQTMRTDSIGQDPAQIGLQQIEPPRKQMSMTH